MSFIQQGGALSPGVEWIVVGLHVLAAEHFFVHMAAARGVIAFWRDTATQLHTACVAAPIVPIKSLANACTTRTHRFDHIDRTHTRVTLARMIRGIEQS